MALTLALSFHITSTLIPGARPLFAFWHPPTQAYVYGYMVVAA